MAMIAVGHPGAIDSLPEDLRPKEVGPRERKPLDKIVFSGSWGAGRSNPSNCFGGGVSYPSLALILLKWPARVPEKWITHADNRCRATLHPERQPLLTAIPAFLATLAALSVFFQKPLTAAFLTNPYLNGTILAAFLFGVLYTLKALTGTLLDGRATDRVAAVALKARRRELPPRQADETLLGEGWRRNVGDFLRKVHRVVSHGDAAASLPYLLDSLATRGDDRRALVRYLVGALVLLGLIGTFYGLLLTIAGCAM
jgi:hypothetical protein